MVLTCEKEKYRSPRKEVRVIGRGASKELRQAKEVFGEGGDSTGHGASWSYQGCDLRWECLEVAK